MGGDERARRGDRNKDEDDGDSSRTPLGCHIHDRARMVGAHHKDFNSTNTDSINDDPARNISREAALERLKQNKESILDLISGH